MVSREKLHPSKMYFAIKRGISPDFMMQCTLMAREAHVRWEPQEEGVMRTSASFPSVRNQGLSNQ